MFDINSDGHGANHACVNVYSIEFAETENAMNYWPGEINLTSQRAHTLFAFRWHSTLILWTYYHFDLCSIAEEAFGSAGPNQRRNRQTMLHQINYVVECTNPANLYEKKIHQI